MDFVVVVSYLAWLSRKNYYKTAKENKMFKNQRKIKKTIDKPNKLW